MYNFNHVYFAPLFIKIEEKPKSYAASPHRAAEAPDALNKSELRAADDIDWKNDEGYRDKPTPGST